MIDPKVSIEAGLLIATGMAFVPAIRREIFKRDHGVCQCGDCIGMHILGKELMWDDGFNVNASHFPDLHQREPDMNMENGRILSVVCHLQEEIERGNHKGVQLLYERQTIMNTRWLKAHSWHDIKPPLNWFYDWQNGDFGAYDAIVDYFRTRLN